MCRICLESDNNEQLISPCLCSGSSQYVHTECIQKWRTTTTNEEAIIMCMECRFHYILHKNCCTMICDNILVYSNYKYVLFIRRLLDYFTYKTLLRLSREKEKLFYNNTILLFYVEFLNLIIMLLLYNITVCLIKPTSFSTSAQLINKLNEYKSLTRLCLFTAIVFIGIQPVISACLISCILDQWYWFFIVSIYNFNIKFRKIINLKK